MTSDQIGAGERPAVIGTKDALELLGRREEALQRRVLLSSGIALLLAAASRLPSWEVAAPVSWLVGTVNVGFLPIFGPILVLGTFAFTFLAVQQLAALRGAIATRLSSYSSTDPVDEIALHTAHPSNASPTRTLQGARLVHKSWMFVVPVVAYSILLASYFDFVRPKCTDTAKPECLEWEYANGGQQKLDLIVGRGGLLGFRPLTPSIKSALERRAGAAEKSNEWTERERLLTIAETIPWIYPPFQTWFYLLVLAFMVAMARHGWKAY